MLLIWTGTGPRRIMGQGHAGSPLDAETEMALDIIGGLLQWTWALGVWGNEYRATRNEFSYSIKAPVSPTAPMWHLNIWWNTVVPDSPPGLRHLDLPCLTLDEAQAICQYHVEHWHLPATDFSGRYHYQYKLYYAGQVAQERQRCRTNQKKKRRQ